MEKPWEGESVQLDKQAMEVLAKEASEIMNVSWDQIDAIKSRAVRRGMARRESIAMKRVYIGEKSYRRRRKYVTCVARLDEAGKARIDYIGDGKGEKARDGFFSALSEEEVAGIEAACVDMS